MASMRAEGEDAGHRDPGHGLAGVRVGRYTIVRALGHGGRGLVYEAQQDDPQRRVALKLVKSPTAEASARLAFEAEILARLRHPSVALVHEAGVDPVHGAYIAMELVEGASHIDQHVRDQALNARDVVRLFVQVCDAVAHGHEKGVVHRDIKPSNVLVDAAGRPKVIDFGVARILGDGREHTTSVGALVGTLRYMSPEQAAGERARVDVRSDVYALGAVLYELLSGHPPIEVEGAELFEAVRRIAEDPPRPLRASRPDLAAELEWITAKALEKDRSRRYANAALLADDLRMYLAGDVVAAGPPTGSYRVRIFARRHRVALATGAGLVLLLGVGGVGAWAARGRALDLAARADRAEGTAAARASELEAELSANREILALQAGWLAPSAIDETGRDARLADVLDRARRELDANPPARANVEAELRYALASAYEDLGMWPPSRDESVKARLALDRGAVFTAEKADALTRLETRMRALCGETDSALERALRHLADVRARLPAGHPEHGRALEVLGGIARLTSDLPAAEARFREAIEILAPHGEARGARRSLVLVLQSARRSDEALAEAHLLVEELRSDPTARRVHRVEAEYALARALGSARRWPESLALLETVRADWASLLGDASPRVAEVDFAMADCCTALGDGPRSLDLSARGVATLTSALGADHPRTREARAKLAMMTIQHGSAEEGIAQFEALLAIGARENAADSPVFLEQQWAYSRALLERELDLERVIDRLRGVVAGCRANGDEVGPLAVLARNDLAATLHRLGRTAECVDLLHENLGAMERTRARLDPDIVSTLYNMGEMSRTLGDEEQAECWLREAHARRVERFGAANPNAWGYADVLAELLARRGDPHEAEVLAAFGIAAQRAAAKFDPAEMGRLYVARARAARSDAVAREALEEGVALAWSKYSEKSALRATLETMLAAHLLEHGELEAALSLAEPVVVREGVAQSTRDEAVRISAAAHELAGRGERAVELRSGAEEGGR